MSEYIDANKFKGNLKTDKKEQIRGGYLNGQIFYSWTAPGLVRRR